MTTHILSWASSLVLQGQFRQTKNPRHKFESVQKIVKSFWTRWTQDVLSSLLTRKKLHVEKRNVTVDDFVIMQSPNAVRGKWNVDRIINVYPGQDYRVRNVKVETHTRLCWWLLERGWELVHSSEWRVFQWLLLVLRELYHCNTIHS